MAQPGGRTLNFVALGISVVALLLGGFAVLRPQPTVNAGPASVPTPTTGTGTPTPTETPSSTGTNTNTDTNTDTSTDTNTSTPDPSAVLPTVGYTISYQDKKLRLTPNTGCGSRFVDLDGPLVTTNSAVSEATFQPCRGEGQRSVQLYFDKQTVATVVSATASAQECANAINTSPAPQTVTLSRQLVICAVTDGTSTPDQPARQRIARIVIDNVSQDGTTDVTVTAWEIPR